MHCLRPASRLISWLQGTGCWTQRLTRPRSAQVNHCVEGNAWHADHIRPVYKGGGLCDLDNLRTLCLPCHAVRLHQQLQDPAGTSSLATGALHVLAPAE